MNRARTFPPSPSFAAMAVTLASQLADYETAEGSEEIADALCDVWTTTEKALTQKAAETVGDLLMKIEILSKIAEHSVIDREEWQALARDVQRLNGSGITFAALTLAFTETAN